MSDDTAKFSVCQLALLETSMDEDIQICKDLGIEMLSLDENKLLDGTDDEVREQLTQAGIKAGICGTRTLSILPSPLIHGPDDPQQRIDDICKGIERLAVFQPQSVFVVTGPVGDYSEKTAREIAIDGLRTAAATARSAGVIFSVEPMRMSHDKTWTFVHSLADMLRIIDEVDDNLKITFDVWHLWDSPDVLPLIRANGSAIAGVQISDYREPTRHMQDRLLPGQGVIDLPGLFGTLEESGYRGWYDLEVFSDLSLPDSIMKRPPREWIAEGRDGFLSAWSARHTSAQG
jgi:sugar phosphate isomerase/epimerase